MGLSGSHQHGFSTGEQWPPAMLQNAAHGSSLYLLRAKGPMIFKFSFRREATHEGVKLKE